MQRQAELLSLRYYSMVNAVLMIIWDILPAVVASSAFVMHTYVLHKPLTPAVGFTALTLYSLLRYPLSFFPDIINNYIRSRISLKRIVTFIKTKDVQGLPRIAPPSNYFSTTGSSHHSSSQENGSLSMLNVTLGWSRTPTTDKGSEEGGGLDKCCHTVSIPVRLADVCCWKRKSLEGQVDIQSDSLKYKLISGDDQDDNGNDEETDPNIPQASPLPSLQWSQSTPQILMQRDPSHSSRKALAVLARLKNIDFDGKVVVDNVTWKIPPGALAGNSLHFITYNYSFIFVM